MKDVQCSPGCPDGEVAGWRVGPGVRIHALRDAVADELADAIRAQHGEGAAHAIRASAVRRLRPTPDGGAVMLVHSLLPGVLGRRGALPAWVGYPATASAVPCVVYVGEEGPELRLTASDVEALGLPAHEPMEARTLLLTTGEPPEGFVVAGEG